MPSDSEDDELDNANKLARHFGLKEIGMLSVEYIETEDLAEELANRELVGQGRRRLRLQNAAFVMNRSSMGLDLLFIGEEDIYDELLGLTLRSGIQYAPLPSDGAVPVPLDENWEEEEDSQSSEGLDRMFLTPETIIEDILWQRAQGYLIIQDVDASMI